MRTVLLGEIAAVERRSVDPAGVDDSTPYLGLEHVGSDGTLDWSQTIGTAGVKSGKFRFSGEHVLFGKLRPYLSKVARPERGGVCSTDIIPILPSTDLDRDYLFHFLRLPATINLATLRSSGANLPRLSPRKLAEFPILLPPLREQKRIAAILDAADALRVKRRESLELLDKLVESVFLDMFGDPVTNPKGWETGPIEKWFEVARGGSPRPIQNYLTDTHDGVNWIMIGDAEDDSRYIRRTAKKIKPEGVRKSRSVSEGDFLLTNSMSFGRPYILKTAGCIHDGWLALSPRGSEVHPEYFYSILSTNALYQEFARRAAGAVVKNLNIALVRSVTIPVPPIAQQEEFAGIVAAVEAQKHRVRSHLAELDTLFASLQSRAFRGEL